MKIPTCCPECKHTTFSAWRYKADGKVIVWYTCDKCGNHWKEEEVS